MQALCQAWRITSQHKWQPPKAISLSCCSSGSSSSRLARCTYRCCNRCLTASWSWFKITCLASSRYHNSGVAYVRCSLLAHCCCASCCVAHDGTCGCKDLKLSKLRHHQLVRFTECHGASAPCCMHADCLAETWQALCA